MPGRQPRMRSPQNEVAPERRVATTLQANLGRPRRPVEFWTAPEDDLFWRSGSESAQHLRFHRFAAADGNVAIHQHCRRRIRYPRISNATLPKGASYSANSFNGVSRWSEKVYFLVRQLLCLEVDLELELGPLREERK
jgi:hypothetical protein